MLPPNGQSGQVADAFNALAPAGFEIAWIPASLGDAEKIEQTINNQGVKFEAGVSDSLFPRIRFFAERLGDYQP